jgi:hypothetical protein
METVDQVGLDRDLRFSNIGIARGLVHQTYQLAHGNEALEGIGLGEVREGMFKTLGFCYG